MTDKAIDNKKVIDMRWFILFFLFLTKLSDIKFRNEFPNPKFKIKA